MDGILHLNVMNRAAKAADFNIFVEGLLEHMNPFPGKNSVLIVDNSSIHKSAEVRAM